MNATDAAAETMTTLQAMCQLIIASGLHSCMRSTSLILDMGVYPPWAFGATQWSTKPGCEVSVGTELQIGPIHIDSYPTCIDMHHW